MKQKIVRRIDITYKLFFFILFSIILACACSSSGQYAPVIDASTIEIIPRAGVYKVRHGDTLYSVAWRYGLDYRYLARRNRLKSPYVLKTGQVIDLRGDHEFISVPNAMLASHLPNVTSKWVFPARGPIINRFSSQNKGIDIGGHIGDPVYAADKGHVVYCGSGLRGYGNLIIVKHNGEFLSAYAHNRSVLVKEGDAVKQGQKIAEMGNSGSGKAILHFEIRRVGKPIDPLLLVKF